MKLLRVIIIFLIGSGSGSAFCDTASLAEAAATPQWDQVRIGFAVHGGAADGSFGALCSLSGQAGPGFTQQAFFFLGDVGPASPGQQGLARAVAGCGAGLFERARRSIIELEGRPLVTADVSVVPALLPVAGYQLDVRLRVRTLTPVADKSRPAYTETLVERTIFVGEQATAVLPLQVANSQAAAFNIYDDLLLRLSPSLVAGDRTPVAGWGGLAVVAEPGAELLLDGVPVGFAPRQGPLIVERVRSGNRELRVRSNSGRSWSKVVNVAPDTLTQLEIRSVPNEESRPALTPLGLNQKGFDAFRRERDGAVVVAIPAAEYRMGLADGAQPCPFPCPAGNPNEHPDHLVRVSAFLMDQHPVTFWQYKRFAEASGRELPEGPYWGIHDDHPAVDLDWDDESAYCQWVGGRLPYEAEWELAARGTDGRVYPWGDEEPTAEISTHHVDWGPGSTEPIGTHPLGASPFGVFDMAGNVWEACADWYDAEYYRRSPEKDPQGPLSGRFHAVRGGSWDSRKFFIRTTARNWQPIRELDFGFRCATDPARDSP